MRRWRIAGYVPLVPAYGSRVACRLAGGLAQAGPNHDFIGRAQTPKVSLGASVFVPKRRLELLDWPGPVASP